VSPARSGLEPIVAQISAALASSLVLEEVLALIARRIAEAAGVWSCHIQMYDARENTLTGVGYWAREISVDDAEGAAAVIDLDERRDYLAIVRDRRILETHIDDPGIAPEERAAMEQWCEKSVLEAPLVFGDEVIGVLSLAERRRVHRFTREEKALLAKLAVPAAIAIHNARLYSEQQERNRHLASLLESSRAMSSTVVLEDVLDLVARKAGVALDSDECVIWEYERESDALVFRSFYSRTGGPGRELVGSISLLEEYPGDRRLLEERAVVEETVGGYALDESSRAAMERFGEKTILNVPLAFNDEPVGVLCLIETGRERRFTEDEMTLASGLGEQAAAAIQNAKLYRREELRSRRLVGLLEASRSMTSSLELREILELLEGVVAGMLSGKACTVDVRVKDAGDQFLPFRLALQAESERRPRAAVPTPHAVVDEALRAAVARQGAGEASGRIVIPLLIRDEVEGYIEAVDAGSRRFAEDEVELVQILANQAAVALQNGRLYETLKVQAITDGLTGLHNHRYFYERLEEEVAKSKRYGAPLSLLMLDLDDFKHFNDAYGHPAGDKVLRQIAGILRRQLRRQIDVVARYGGEEFAVILPSTPLSGAQAVGDRLQRQVSVRVEDEAGVPELVGERIRAHVANALFGDEAGEGGIGITVSIGVATFPDNAADAAGLVRAADKALYLAKRLGKDRVEVFG
jgi:diguanylate cyclase (GGDEF)-like protein